MDNARKYVQEARAKKFADEDIIMALSKQGWSIQEIHGLLYNDHPVSAGLFPNNPKVNARNVQQQQVVNTAVAQDQPVQAETAPPSIPLEPEQPTKTTHRLRKVLLVTMVVVIVFAAGVGAGVGGGYLYITSQLKKYTATADEVSPSSVAPTDYSPNSTSVDSSTKPKSNTASSDSNPNCQTNNKKIPDGVCVAIQSIINDPSPSNPYFSRYKGEIPSGVKIISVDENSWSAQSRTKGTIEAKASVPIAGKTSLTALFEKLSGEWKVTEIY